MKKFYVPEIPAPFSPLVNPGDHFIVISDKVYICILIQIKTNFLFELKILPTKTNFSDEYLVYEFDIETPSNNLDSLFMYMDEEFEPFILGHLEAKIHAFKNCPFTDEEN